jgi:hypothetical protein
VNSERSRCWILRSPGPSEFNVHEGGATPSEMATKKPWRSLSFNLLEAYRVPAAGGPGLKVVNVRLCRLFLRKLRAELAPFDGLGIAVQDVEFRLFAFAPEADIEPTPADTQILQGQVWKPVRQCRIDVQFPVRLIRR